ncbi:uncharacterized protein L3040_005094 [Drepanopeziza brunnea f. sp. 'multigermtubi']|uniref:uncharacterized protein n=1 Tax=Drepanopeziza brunnea f. sp. 'multigermtubi' TaxID=698441 RepID=UPI00239FE34D|nr:hypothetical protein L3040_005094 [Drepanopeziza brunnea f. sp. 'multigermtubi']
MMNFIDGVSASNVLRDPSAEHPTKLLMEASSGHASDPLSYPARHHGGFSKNRPTNCGWDCNTDGKEPPGIVSRYFKYLEIFMHVLEEEEAELPGREEKELSSLVKWSQASGAMWLHILLLPGLNDEYIFPFILLRRHLLGTAKRAEREKVFDNAEELDLFAARKVGELDEYYKALEKRDKDKELVDSGKMTNGEFVVRTRDSACRNLWPLEKCTVGITGVMMQG